MAITDAIAIKFSNEQFRPAADRIASCGDYHTEFTRTKINQVLAVSVNSEPVV